MMTFDFASCSCAELLTELARNPDGPAWSALLARLGQDVRQAAARAAGADLADDAVQEAAMQVRQSAGRFTCPPGADPDRCARAWVRSVAVHAALELYRQRTRHAIRAQRALNRAPRSEPVNPAQAIERQETTALVRAALATLPAAMRDAVIMRHLEGFDTATTAALLKRPEGTVKTLVRRGLERLRVCLQAHQPGLSATAIMALIAAFPAIASSADEAPFVTNAKQAPSTSPFPPARLTTGVISMTVAASLVLSSALALSFWTATPAADQPDLRKAPAPATASPATAGLADVLDAMPSDTTSLGIFQIREVLAMLDQVPATGRKFRESTVQLLQPLGLTIDNLDTLVLGFRDDAGDSTGGVLHGRGIGRRLAAALAAGTVPKSGVVVTWHLQGMFGLPTMGGVQWISTNDQPWLVRGLDDDHILFGQESWLKQRDKSPSGADQRLRRSVAVVSPDTLVRSASVPTHGSNFSTATSITRQQNDLLIGAELHCDSAETATQLAPMITLGAALHLTLNTGSERLDACLNDVLKSSLPSLRTTTKDSVVLAEFTITSADQVLQKAYPN